MSSNDENVLTMLVVEDNTPDVVLFKEALEDSRLPAVLHVVGDGDFALRFLRKQAPFTDASRPDVVVLDLNLPVKSGREVLAEMASDPALNSIPVSILTTSEFDEDVCELYSPGRCLYFTKTSDFHELVDIVKRIKEFAASGIGGDN